MLLGSDPWRLPEDVNIERYQAHQHTKTSVLKKNILKWGGIRWLK